MEDSRLGRGAFVGSEGEACIDHAGVTSRHVVFMQEATDDRRNYPTPMRLALEPWKRYQQSHVCVRQVRRRGGGDEVAYKNVSGELGDRWWRILSGVEAAQIG